MTLALASSSFGLAEDRVSKSSLITRLNWMQFEVVMGRIVALNSRYEQTRTASTGDVNSDYREILSLSVDNGIPSVRYERRTSTDLLSLEVIEGNQVELTLKPRGENQQDSLHYFQPHEGRVRLTIGEQSVEAVNVWHLFMVASKDQVARLCSCLEYLRPGWRLPDTATAIETALFRLSTSGYRPDKEQVNRLVRQLGSKSFKTRQRADRELRGMGIRVLSALADVDTLRLDSEQKARMEGIRQAVMSQSDDTPERVASWMIEDRQVWLTLLSHGDMEKRIAALEHLSDIAGHHLEYDPTAAEAIRRTQIETLTARLAP